MALHHCPLFKQHKDVCAPQILLVFISKDLHGIFLKSYIFLVLIYIFGAGTPATNLAKTKKMVPSSVYFHTSLSRLCSEQIFLLKILKNTGKVNQTGKGESIWCSKCSGSKRAQNSVFRGPKDILYQNENFLA